MNALARLHDAQTVTDRTWLEQLFKIGLVAYGVAHLLGRVAGAAAGLRRIERRREPAAWARHADTST